MNVQEGIRVVVDRRCHVPGGRPGRAAIILDKYFSKLLEYRSSRLYTVYNAFPVKQRCWVHILRKAEKFAIRKGGNYLSCHLRLLAMYKRIKDRESASCAECLDLERAVLEIAASYGDAKTRKSTYGLKFKATLESLRYMPPHNNGADVGDTRHRRAAQERSSPKPLSEFRWRAVVTSMGIFKPMRVAVEELMITGWSIFKPT